MNTSYAGKAALITGGTSGIGEATVRLLSARGAKVVFTGSNQAAAAAISKDTGAVFVRHSVDDVAGWEEVVAAVERLAGRLDLAFSNVGTNTGDASIEDVKVEDWNRLIGLNLTGAMLTCKHAIRLMKKNPGGPGGAIVLNSSMNGILALAGDVTYSTTKGALRLLMRSVALHCAQKGYRIRCNTIHPGLVDTPLIRGVINGAPDPKAVEALLSGISPLKRMASSMEVAALVAFLGSDEAGFISGSEYGIDGASTAGLPGA